MRVVHMAKKVNALGDVLPVCSETVVVDMTRSSWTTSTRAVTCAKCVDLLVAEIRLQNEKGRK